MMLECSVDGNVKAKDDVSMGDEEIVYWDMIFARNDLLKEFTNP